MILSFAFSTVKFFKDQRIIRLILNFIERLNQNIILIFIFSFFLIGLSIKVTSALSNDLVIELNEMDSLDGEGDQLETDYQLDCKAFRRLSNNSLGQTTIYDLCPVFFPSDISLSIPIPPPEPSVFSC